MTCTPPNGMSVLNASRRRSSIASKRSALTIDISSIMSVSIRLRREHTREFLGNLPLRCSSGARRNRECIVCPLTFKAAMPVGAATTDFFFVFSLKWRRRTLFPVPARPVMKRCWWDCSITSNKACCSGLSVISLWIVIELLIDFSPLVLCVYN